MKSNLENLKESISKVTLTSEEKFDMFQNIRAYSNTHPVRSRYSMFMKYSVVYASMITILIGTTATSIAAEGALPGDILYSVKTNVNEEVVKTLNFSAPQKAKFAVERMDKRMVELEKMIIKKTDSPEKIDVIVAKLEEHKSDLQDFANQVESTNTVEVEEASEIYATLDSVMDAHIDILEEIQEDENAILASTTPSDIIVTKKVSEDQDQVDGTTPDTNVILTMSATNSEEPTGETSTLTEITTNEIAPSITGEQDAITEIVNFSERLDPLIESTQEQEEQGTTTEKLKSDIRKRILDKAEEELQVKVEEETTIEIQTIIK